MEMKAARIVMMVTMMLALTGQVMAVSWLPKIYTVGEGNDVVAEPDVPVDAAEYVLPEDMCGEPMFSEEITMIEDMDVVKEMLSVFGNGYQVVAFKEPYMGHDTYTVYLEEGAVLWIKPGICHNGQYEVYTIARDMNTAYETFTNPETDMFMEGYNFLKDVEGITGIQKIQLMAAVMKHGLGELEALIPNETN